MVAVVDGAADDPVAEWRGGRRGAAPARPGPDASARCRWSSPSRTCPRCASVAGRRQGAARGRPRADRRLRPRRDRARGAAGRAWTRRWPRRRPPKPLTRRRRRSASIASTRSTTGWQVVAEGDELPRARPPDRDRRGADRLRERRVTRPIPAPLERLGIDAELRRQGAGPGHHGPHRARSSSSGARTSDRPVGRRIVAGSGHDASARTSSRGRSHGPQRIGILGGTFDPPHVGHLWLATPGRRRHASLDRVLFMPAAQPPHKQGRSISPIVDRLLMTRLAIGGNDLFELTRSRWSAPGPRTPSTASRSCCAPTTMRRSS